MGRHYIATPPTTAKVHGRIQILQIMKIILFTILIVLGTMKMTSGSCFTPMSVLKQAQEMIQAGDYRDGTCVRGDNWDMVDIFDDMLRMIIRKEDQDFNPFRESEICLCK